MAEPDDEEAPGARYGRRRLLEGLAVLGVGAGAGVVGGRHLAATPAPARAHGLGDRVAEVAAGGAGWGWAGAVTARSTSLHDERGSFRASDVGRSIVVAHAGAGGGGLATTIAAWVDHTSVTLASPAGSTATGCSYVHWADDDTERIAAAIARAGVGGTVRLLGGAYVVARSLRLSDWQTLEGAGVGTMLVAAPHFADADGMITLAGPATNHVTVRDLWLHGHDAAPQEHSFSAVHLDQAGGHGLYGDAGHHLANLIITEPPGHGVVLTCSAEAEMAETSLDGVSVLRPGGRGFWFRNVTDGHARHCVAADPAAEGFRLDGIGNWHFGSSKAYYCGDSGPAGWAAGFGWYLDEASARNQFSTCEAQDCFNSGWFVGGSSNSFAACLADANANRSGNVVGAGFVLGPSSRANVLEGCAASMYRPSNQRHAVQFAAGATGNRVAVSFGAAARSASGGEPARAVDPTNVRGNRVEVNGEGGTQSLAYAATVAPDPYLGSHAVVGVLTGDLHFAAPVDGHDGSQLVLQWAQDAVGGRIVTFDGAYRQASTLSTAPGATTIVSFRFDGTAWWQTAAASGL